MDGPALAGRDRPRLEVADVLRDHAPALSLTGEQARVVVSLLACRTAAIGGHLEVCDSCGHSRPAYNSCRDRHCPKCQGLAQELWAEAQEQRLLPVPYYHVVFTIPAELHPFFRLASRVCLGLLFEAVSETLLQVARRRLKATIGFLAILHTWTQKLLFHPHIHCVVPGGGLSLDGGRWISTGRRFLLPVRVLRRVFRGKLLSKIEAAVEAGEIPISRGRARSLLQQAARTTWVVYAKRPLAGPEQVVRYVARYTRRIAISNSRLVAYDGECVTFTWKDRAHGNQRQKLRLPGREFAARFLQHVLPRRFVRVRHYGLLANRTAVKSVGRCREALGAGKVEAPSGLPAAHESWVDSYQRLFGVDPLLCPACGVGHLVPVLPLPGRVSAATVRLPRPPP